MERISKQEMEYLIQNNIIRLNKQGNYGDNLIVTGSRHHSYDHHQHNSQHKSRKKQRFTTEYIYNKLQELREKDYKKIISDINNVKDNQRYMFT